MQNHLNLKQNLKNFNAKSLLLKLLLLKSYKSPILSGRKYLPNHYIPRGIFLKHICVNFYDNISHCE